MSLTTDVYFQDTGKELRLSGPINVGQRKKMWKTAKFQYGSDERHFAFPYENIHRFEDKKEFMEAIGFIAQMSSEAAVRMTEIWLIVFEKDFIKPYKGDLWEIPETSLFKQEGHSLYPHQEEGIRYGLARLAALHAFDMGLGKTIMEMVMGMTMLKLGWIRPPLMFIGPAKIKMTVYDEAKRIGIVPYTYPKEDHKRLYPNVASALKSDVVIMSYAMLGKFYARILLGRGFEYTTVMTPHLFIFDESQYIKNPESNRGKAGIDIAVRALAKKGRVSFSSGTPIMNHPIDLFSTLHIVSPAQFPNYYQFMDKYMPKKAVPVTEIDEFGIERKKLKTRRFPENLDDLHEKMMTFTLRRVKSDCLADLPPKTRRIVHSKVPYKPPVYEDNILSFMNSCKQDVAIAKMDSTYELALEAAPALIYSEYLRPTQHVWQKLDENGFSAALFIGAVSQAKRQEIIVDFRSGKYDFVCATIGAAGIGINLERAENVLFNDPHWGPGKNMQAEDRAHRLTTKHNVMVAYNMLATDTFDRQLHEIMFDKLVVLRKVMDGIEEESAMGNSVRKDLLIRLLKSDSDFRERYMARRKKVET